MYRINSTNNTTYVIVKRFDGCLVINVYAFIANIHLHIVRKKFRPPIVTAAGVCIKALNPHIPNAT